MTLAPGFSFLGFVCFWGHTCRCPGLTPGSALKDHSWWAWTSIRAADWTRVNLIQGKLYYHFGPCTCVLLYKLLFLDYAKHPFNTIWSLFLCENSSFSFNLFYFSCLIYLQCTAVRKYYVQWGILRETEHIYVTFILKTVVFMKHGPFCARDPLGPHPVVLVGYHVLL